MAAARRLEGTRREAYRVRRSSPTPGAGDASTPVVTLVDDSRAVSSRGQHTTHRGVQCLRRPASRSPSGAHSPTSCPRPSSRCRPDRRCSLLRRAAGAVLDPPQLHPGPRSPARPSGSCSPARRSAGAAAASPWRSTSSPASSGSPGTQSHAHGWSVLSGASGRLPGRLRPGRAALRLARRPRQRPQRDGQRGIHGRRQHRDLCLRRRLAGPLARTSRSLHDGRRRHALLHGDLIKIVLASMLLPGAWHLVGRKC